jgi:hypothetical protein
MRKIDDPPLEQGAIRTRKAWRYSMEILLNQQINKIEAEKAQALPHYETTKKRRQLADHIWLEIRSRWLHSTTISDEIHFLEEKRRSLTDFVLEIEDFHMDSYEGKDPEAVVKRLLDDYERYKSYFPSSKRMIEHFGRLIDPIFIERMDVLQSWLRHSELIDRCLGDLEFLLRNNKFYQEHLTLWEQSDDFFLLISQDEGLYLCYQKYLEWDACFILPKLQAMINTFGQNFEQLGLPLRLQGLKVAITSVPNLQLRSFGAHVNYFETSMLNVEHDYSVEERIVAFIIDRSQSMSLIRKVYCDTGLFDWVRFEYDQFLPNLASKGI